jgi:hypothetical protein
MSRVIVVVGVLRISKCAEPNAAFPIWEKLGVESLYVAASGITINLIQILP